MSYQATNRLFDKIALPAGAAGQVTASFSAPNNALGVVFWFPQLAANVAYKVQALQPKDGDQDADSYADLSTALTNNAGAIQVSTVSGMGSSSAPIAYSMDAGVLGAGVFRLVSTGAGTAVAATAYVIWRVDLDRHR